MRRRDNLHREALQSQQEFWKVKEEFGTTLAEVRHELQILTDRPSAPQSEACSQTGLDEMLIESEPCVTQPDLPPSQAFRPMQMSPALPQPVIRATCEHSHRRTRHRRPSSLLVPGSHRGSTTPDLILEHASTERSPAKYPSMAPSARTQTD